MTLAMPSSRTRIHSVKPVARLRGPKRAYLGHGSHPGLVVQGEHDPLRLVAVLFRRWRLGEGQLARGAANAPMARSAVDCEGGAREGGAVVR